MPSRMRHHGGMFLRHPILSIATFAYLAIVVWLTLTPMPSPNASGLLWDLALFFERSTATEWLTFNTLEFLANIAMFAPFGLFLVLLLGRRQWWLAILIGVGFTLAIELAQQFIPNRVSDPRDIVANSLGTIVGTLFALVMTAAKARRLRKARIVQRTAV